MTIKNENDNSEMRHYACLQYIEFVEFLCRIAINKRDDIKDTMLNEISNDDTSKEQPSRPQSTADAGFVLNIEKR